MANYFEKSEDGILVWGTSSINNEEATPIVEPIESAEPNLADDADLVLSGRAVVAVADLTPEDSVVDEGKDLVLDELDTEDYSVESETSVYDKKYYKISEVESIIGENQSTIRFWEDAFSELGKNFCSYRTRGGTRKFTKENVENLKLLKLLLRDRRLTIEGAISEIKNERRRNVKERALILLQETREELNDLIDAYNCILHQNCM